MFQSKIVSIATRRFAGSTATRRSAARSAARPELTCIWVPTGNVRAPLAALWVEFGASHETSREPERAVAESVTAGDLVEARLTA